VWNLGLRGGALSVVPAALERDGREVLRRGVGVAVLPVVVSMRRILVGSRGPFSVAKAVA
jgi:hypothetical protein